MRDLRAQRWFEAIAQQEYIHVQKLCRFLVMGSCLDASCSDDLTQQVFYTAYQKLGEFYLHPKPRAYLFKIAQYLFKNMLRRQYYQLRMREISLDDPNAQGFFDKQARDVMESLILSDTMESLHKALSGLSGKDQLLYRQLYTLGLGIPALCEYYGASERAIKKRIYRLQQRLLKQVGE